MRCLVGTAPKDPNGTPKVPHRRINNAWINFALKHKIICNETHLGMDTLMHSGGLKLDGSIWVIQSNVGGLNLDAEGLRHCILLNVKV